MDSLDAALRRAELCMFGSKVTSDYVTENSIDNPSDDIGDPLQDIEEEGISSSPCVSSQQTATSVRTPQLRNRSRLLKKRNRLQKDLEHALPLALLEQPSESESQGCALSYFQKLREQVESLNSAVFDELLTILNEFGESFHSPTDLYHRVILTLKDHPDLCEEFLIFMLPHQALHCGKFMEHLSLMEMASFLRRLELYFSKQPQHLRKILASWARLADTPNVTLDAVRSTILPLLRGNTFLIDSFLELMPGEKPPESKITDFDHVTHDEIEREYHRMDDTFEHVEIPPVKDDPYGNEHCNCCCHDSSSDLLCINRAKHCVACGLKFISGKVFIQTEHGLRPVCIQFSGGGSNSANVKRLNSNPRKLPRSRCRRGRLNTLQVTRKAEDAKQNHETDDDTGFSNKGKSPRSHRSRMPKPCREKSVKSLSLSRSVGNRKPTISKVLTVRHDHEALPAEDRKPVVLDFSSLSDVLRTACLKQDGTASSEGDSRPTSIEHIGDDGSSRRGSIVASGGILVSKEQDSLGDVQCDVDVDVSSESSDGNIEDVCDDVPEESDTSWTREEDRIILRTFQAEPDREKTIAKISSLLPNRSKNEISCRFQILMSLIQKMR